MGGQRMRVPGSPRGAIARRDERVCAAGRVWSGASRLRRVVGGEGVPLTKGGTARCGAPPVTSTDIERLCEGRAQAQTHAQAKGTPGQQPMQKVLANLQRDPSMVSVTHPALLEPESTFHRSGAKLLGPEGRKRMAIGALAGDKPITEIADALDVSRKFVYQQAEKADEALDEAFAPSGDDKDDEVLFYIPVTKRWIAQVVLAVLLHCHASIRGVQCLLRDVCDYKLSVGGIHNVIASAMERARLVNSQEDLSTITVGAHDEIFQGDLPVLAGVDPHSTYCYLLTQESSRDGDTWALCLMDLSERGLSLEHTVADAGSGLRAGQAVAWPETPCWGDVFHAEHDFVKMATYLDNRAFGCIGHCYKVERRMARAKKKQQGKSFSKKLALARAREATAISLADDVRILLRWLREDVLSLIGPKAQTRRELFDFIVAELRAREELAKHRIRPVRVALENQRDDLLAFAEDIDRRLALIARGHAVPCYLVRKVFELHALAAVDPRRWAQDGALWKQLGPLYPAVQEAVRRVASTTVRASSMVENYNSRLRNYFFLRRHLGDDYLELLRFFLNHRRYPRSRKEERAGRSPAEILHGRAFPHWLEQVGFTRFSRAA